ncbi:MAG: dihydropteroate synthase [Actinomycetota bacterium]
MGYKIRKVNIGSRESAIEEFKKIGAALPGIKIMSNKLFMLCIKIKGIDSKAANILKQEMLSRGGDVVTSREALVNTGEKTDVIIMGNRKSINTLVGKIKMQPFGLKELSGIISGYLKKLDNRDKLIIADKEYELAGSCLVMGILNVTPDSFYDGGRYFKKGDAFKKADKLIADGADIIDIGGMSTRPGSRPVSVEEEITRTVPAVRHVCTEYPGIPVSIDTYRSEVARRALGAGASIINDISAFSFDRQMMKVAKEYQASVVLMHIKGTPEDMQKNPCYEDVVDEIYDFLYQRSEIAKRGGINPEKIIIDPGIGFGKSLKHNLIILKKLSDFKSMGYPLLAGASRKSFIGMISDLEADDRLEGSMAAAVYSYLNGANILRVHDVLETKRAIEIAGEIRNV